MPRTSRYRDILSSLFAARPTGSQLSHGISERSSQREHANPQRLQSALHPRTQERQNTEQRERPRETCAFSPRRVPAPDPTVRFGAHESDPGRHLRVPVFAVYILCVVGAFPRFL